MNLIEILDSIYPLPEKSKSSLVNNIIEVAHSRGTILLKAEKIETNVFFIKRGIVRAYAKSSETEITFWFGKEGDTIISMRSYVASGKGYENIELLEDCELFELNSDNLQKLFLEDLNIANWGRKFAEKELLKTEERLISRQFRSATERYKDLLRDQSDLVQRVQLGYIASYLGITQVSLSRIRAEIR
jgi:CRP-like cAMP-binding protein